MPLRTGSSKSTIQANIAELIRAGHEPAQAAAIAYRKARGDRRRKRRRAGDTILLTPIQREPVGGINGQIVDAPDYVPPPGPGTAENHYAIENDPAATSIRRRHPAATAPDPNTPPTVYRSDARRSRVPRQMQPKPIEVEYAKALVGVVKRARAHYAPLLRQLPALLEAAHAAQRGDRMDAGESGKIRAMVHSAIEATRKAIKRDEVESLARKFAARTSTYQRLQLARQVRSALGADPVFKDRGLAARVDHFAHENASLIVRIPERLHGDVETMVSRAVASGRPHPDLAKEIGERFDVSERHARLIARDQVSKFYGSLNHARQAEMGVSRFVWRTAGDERVRDEHKELDGEEFDYDDPPIIDGEPSLPSEPVQCRCWAEPIFEDVEEEEDEGDEDEDEE